jgi:hypothetical protein
MLRTILVTLLVLMWLPASLFAQQTPATFLASADSVKGEVYDLCHFAYDGGWTWEQNFQNKDGSTAAEATLFFRGSDGSITTPPLNQGTANPDGSITIAIPAGGSTWVKVLASPSRNLTSGHVQVLANSKVGLLGVFGLGRSTVQVTPCPLQIGHEIPADFQVLSASTKSTGFAMANNNGFAVVVTGTLVDQTGAPQASASVTLPANGHLAQFVEEFFKSFFKDANGNLVRNEFHGKIKLSASVEISVMSIGSESFSDGDFRFYSSPSQPPATANTASVQRQAYAFVPQGVPVLPDYVAGVQFQCDVIRAYWDLDSSLHGQGKISDWVDFRKDKNGKCDVKLVVGNHDERFYADEGASPARNGIPTMHAEVRDWEAANGITVPGYRLIVYQNSLTATAYSTGTDAVTFGPMVQMGGMWSDYSWNWLNTACRPGMPIKERLRFLSVFPALHAGIHEVGHTMRLGHSNDLHEADAGSANIMVGDPFSSIPGADIGSVKTRLFQNLNTCQELWVKVGITPKEMKVIREWRDRR